MTPFIPVPPARLPDLATPSIRPPVTASATASPRPAATASAELPAPWVATLRLAPAPRPGGGWRVPEVPGATFSWTPGTSATLELPPGSTAVGELALPSTGSLPAATVSLRVEAAAPPPPAARLVLMHTADTYGNLEPVGFDRAAGQVVAGAPVQAGGKARLACAVVRQRRQAVPVLLLSAGNELGPDAEAAQDQGQRIVRAMGLMGYDAWAPSTYDFAYGLDALTRRMAEAGFPVVCANARLADSDDPLAPASHLFELGGVKVEVIGLADPRSADLLPPADRDRVTFDDPLDVLHRLLPELRRSDHPDLVVVLAHLPEPTIRRLLAAGSGVDVVLGGIASRRESDLAVRELVGMAGKRAFFPGGYGAALGRAEVDFAREPGGTLQPAALEGHDVWLDEPQPAASSDCAPVVGLVKEARAQLAATWKRQLAVVPRFASALSAPDAMRLVAGAARWKAGAEVAALPSALFLDGGAFDPVADPEALYATLRRDDPLVRLTVSADQLSAVQQALSDGSGALVGAVQDDDGNLKVDGRPVDPDGYYALVAPSSAVAPGGPLSDATKGAARETLDGTVRGALLAFLGAPGADGRPREQVGFADLPDPAAVPFWKSNLTLDLAFSDRQVQVDANAYPDLPWNNDQSALHWGAEVLYKLGARWGADAFDGRLDLDFEQDEVGPTTPTTTTDRIQLRSEWRRDQQVLPVTTWTGLDLDSRFHQLDPASPFLLSQVSGGLAQQLPCGLSLREGLAFRKLFFQPVQRVGVLLRGQWQHAFPWLVIDGTLDVLGTPVSSADGLVTDLETKFTVPVTPWIGVSLTEAWYSDSTVPAPANRTVVGLSFALQHPWVPPTAVSPAS